MNSKLKIIAGVAALALISGAAVASGVAISRLSKGVQEPTTSKSSGSGSSSGGSSKVKIIPEKTVFYF